MKLHKWPPRIYGRHGRPRVGDVYELEKVRTNSGLPREVHARAPKQEPPSHGMSISWSIVLNASYRPRTMKSAYPRILLTCLKFSQARCSDLLASPSPRSPLPLTLYICDTAQVPRNLVNTHFSRRSHLACLLALRYP